MFSTSCHAGLCAKIEPLFTFETADRLPSPYFDEYYIRQSDHVFYIAASKVVELDFSNATLVMNDLESHPSFIPGYQSIRVIADANEELLTGIHFHAAFSPFSSRFTNRVEIINEQAHYRQCWEQLDAEDGRVIAAYKNAPMINRGYWLFERQSEDLVGIHYFSMLQPPLMIPTWLYTRMLGSGYIGLFEQVIARIRQVRAVGFAETGQ
ncbi:MAG: hypothetical protein QNJ78_11320 [Gammaproteobacteria bacterium]|nr:hypothetical protein [Gammaproteobacteria bacterium]